MPRPAIVAHADWSLEPRKRWLATARLDGDRYTVGTPEPVGDSGTLLTRLRGDATPVLVGFDFPIGVPIAYAERAGIRDFVAFLRDRFGLRDWSEFANVAERREQISVRRPFYPLRPGGTRQQHLCDGLGVAALGDLRRACERQTSTRRPACPLFWTLGGNQVGKAALSGWRDVLVPALRGRSGGVAIWPFHGSLTELVEGNDVVIAETYPTEYYGLVGFTGGKRLQERRRAAAAGVLAWFRTAGIEAGRGLVAELEDGFGSEPDGEDRFDAVAGLVGMLAVVLGRREPGEDGSPEARVEGWILGQARAAAPAPGIPASRPGSPLTGVEPGELERASTNYVVGSALLFENDRVRVWDITLGPGERTPFHCHRTTYFYRCESGGRWRVRTLDGEVLTGEDAPGEVTFHELGPGELLVHELTNVGEAPLCYTTVELVS